ncbi:MAG TPA: signal peptide peptidase SppA [Desulfotomaculum sp.]|nr:signal peptide peptidase SppA [Desulfotomaculum sp.]
MFLKGKKKIISGLILAVIIIFLIVTVVIIKPRQESRPVSRGGVVAVVDIEGIIVSGQSSAGLFGTSSSAEYIAGLLKKAARDENIKAVVLRLNSPGGSAAGSQEIAREVDLLRQKKKKVIASMGDVAASGAYWIAARADKIVANSGTMTGSIGVIIQTQDLRGLYSKLGVDSQTFKSGPHKDMGSATREITPEEKVIFQGLVDNVYQQFIQAVAEGRKMEPDRVRKIADGRIFTGQQAREKGLVDELGSFNDALSLAGRMSGLGSEPPVQKLTRRGFWQDLLDPQITNLAGFLWFKENGSFNTYRQIIFPAGWLVCPSCWPVIIK